MTPAVRLGAVAGRGTPAGSAAEGQRGSVDGRGTPAGSAAEGQRGSIDDTFSALADPTRRGVINLLRTSPRRAGELADQLGMSRPAMSRHLKVLRITGLIEPASDDADARAKVYQLRPEPFSALRDWLDEVEQLWTDQLVSFKAHAEARVAERRRGKRS